MSANYLLNELIQRPAPDMTDSDKILMRKTIERGVGVILNNEKEQGPFALYIMGDNYPQIASKTGWPLETVLLTALKFQWYDKKQRIELDNDDTRGKEAPRHVLQTAMNSILAATAQTIIKEMQAVMKGELDYKQSKFIPKDPYAIEKLLSTVAQINKWDSQDKKQGQQINVNIANLPGGNNVAISANPNEPKQLGMQNLTLEEYQLMPREERLKMLQAVATSKKEDA